MNTSALKTFAQEARKKLRQQIGTRLDYWLGSDSAEHRQFAPQIKELKDALEKEGRELLVERVAYTWFNRLAALRFMDANGYHPFGVRVVTPATEQHTMPELLQQARGGVLDEGLRAELPTPETFDLLIAGRMPIDHPEAEAYRLLIFAVGHYYHRLMPFLFEKLGDATELLLPGDLLTEHSILADFREGLSDEDCREVEVIGWLYQFYISEKKDAVMARKTAVPKEDIPAVTQLFTPHWIVRYLVDNSLGRLWLLNKPHSRLREQMPYYIEGEPETDILKIGKPEEIRLLDPACGSGHMLTYAFDLLYAIYEEEGYDAAEIPSLILRHNLYGLEICERAAALAAFALCMKARSRDKRFFRRLANGGADMPQPQIVELQDVRFRESELQDYIAGIGLGGLFNGPMLKLLHQFEEAKNFGSLIQPCLDERAIAFARHAIKTKDLGGQLFLQDTHVKVLRVLKQAEALTQRYHVVVANPPYMGASAMNPALKTFIEAGLSFGKTDTYSAFMLRNLILAMPHGYVGMITIPNWMFIRSFEDLRKTLLTTTAFVNFVHCGRGVWGADVGRCAFGLESNSSGAHVGSFRRLFRRQGEVQTNAELEANFLDTVGFPPHRARPANFQKVQGSPIAYWAGEKTLDAFESFGPLGSFADTRLGMATADNEQFLRHWHETDVANINFIAVDREGAIKSGCRWFPYAKGGDYHKWYGNYDYVVEWRNDGEAIRNFTDKNGKVRSHNYNLDHIFTSGITWNALSSSNTSMRLLDHALFDNAGSSCFPPPELRKSILTFLNSKLLKHFLEVISPTVNYQPGDIARVPLNEESVRGDGIRQVGAECVELARSDWDNFETSWGFLDQPLLRPGLKGATMEASWRNWEAQSTAAIRRMQELETENNSLFIAAYGLDGELQPEVPEEQITLARADARRDAAALVSYAVGCLMGRYSLDVPGLVMANQGEEIECYYVALAEKLNWSILQRDTLNLRHLEAVAKERCSFLPDADGILPVLDGEWFADDVVARMEEFIGVVWGRECVRENVAWLEQALGKVDKKTGKTKQTDLRTYFLRDFYANHLSNERAYGYKKRPIYWLVSSPEGSFQALLYMHRYTRDTLNVLLQDYLRAFIHKLEEKERHLTAVTINESARPSDRTAATKELGKIQKNLRELKNWERDVVLPLAQQRIEIDLDDGVKVNYLKFPGLLAKIPGLEKTEE